LGAQNVINFLLAFIWEDHEVDPIKGLPITGNVGVTHLDQTQVGVGDGHFLQPVVITNNQAIMPHPAFMPVDVPTLDEHREAGRDQAFHQVKISTITHNAIQLGLFLHVSQHFIRHDVSILDEGFQDSFGGLLVAFPAPET